MEPALDDLPGYRRRFIVTPRPGWVRAELEDDYHHMAVTIRHADGVATEVVPDMKRQPWTTCPGAERRLVDTFTGVALADFATRGEKTTNCTHLHDLAVLAGGHASDAGSTVYEVLCSDAIEGLQRAEFRRNGEARFRWLIKGGFELVEPAEFAGLHIMKIKPLLQSLDLQGQEEIKLFRWGVVVGHGRAIPLENQSDATRIPPNCWTFQPENAVHARRVGEIRDFSRGDIQPLDGRTEAQAA